jgi:hypothetical protein
MQFFTNEVFSAPTSFFVLASLRHAVRLACFAAASLGGAVGDAGAGFAGAAAGALLTGASAACAGDAAANPPATGNRLRHAAAATVEKRMGTRIALTVNRTDEARMKLA